jgi:phosphoglucomutase
MIERAAVKDSILSTSRGWHAAARSSVLGQQVAFGTWGHRGSAFDCGSNEDPILAITCADQ